MKTIPIYIEDKTGHTTKEVPENEVQTEVEQQLKDEKWVTLEKENTQGEVQTEILTKEDMPTPTPTEVRNEKANTLKTITAQTTAMSVEQIWANKFKNVKSATATSKAKGG